MRASSAIAVLATALLCVLSAAHVKGETAASPNRVLVAALTQSPALLTSADGTHACGMLAPDGELALCS
jgi:hypothetical protein